MTLNSIPVGSVLERTYYALPELYGIGEEVDDWDEAVMEAQQNRLRLLDRLISSLGTYSTKEQIEEMVNRQVRIDLRWLIRLPDGTHLDTVVEKYYDVHKLRTRASLSG